MSIHPQCKVKLGLVPVLCSPMLFAEPLRPSGHTEQPAVIGQILNSSGATVDGLPIPASGTVVSGETISTAKDGNAVVDLSPGTRLNLDENTSVSFAGRPSHVSAEVTKGAVTARTSGKDALLVETPRYVIEPTDPGPSAFLVTILPERNTEIAARRGSVRITEKSTGQKYVLAQGHFAKVAGADAAMPPQAQTAATAATAGAPPGLLGSPVAMFVISVGAGVGTGFAIGEGALSEPGPASPSAP